MSDEKSGGLGCTSQLDFVEDHYGAMGHNISSLSVSCTSLQFDESWTAPPSPKVVEATHYLTAVMVGYDADALSEACLRLTEIIQQADAEVLQLLYDRDVVGVLLRTLGALPSHSAAQQAGCEVLRQCNEQPELRGMLEDHCAYRYILLVMKNHSGDSHLLSKALYTLASLAATVLSDAGLKESKAYLPILSALKTFLDDIDVQSGGLLALATVLRTDAYVTGNLMLQGEHKVVLDSMRTHAASPLVVAHGCKALRSLAITDMGVSVLLANGEVMGLVVAALQSFGEVEEVVCAACELLEPLASAESAPLSFKQDVNRLRVVGHLVAMIEKYTEVLDIQVHAFSALGHLVSLPDVDLGESDMELWLGLLQDALTNHGREPPLQEAACRCLAHLLEVNPYLHLSIGEGKNQIPLHTHVWITLLNQITTLHQVEGAKPTVYKAVTFALYFLIVDDESLQRRLLEKGAAVAVLEGLREFLHEPTRNERCIESGCRALIGLIMSNNLENEKQPHPLGSPPTDLDRPPVEGQPPSPRRNPLGGDEGLPVEVQARRQLEEAGVAEELTRILDDFLHDPEVLVEAFGVIACLADVSAFQEAVVSHYMYKQVLQAVEKHHNHAVLVESALEVMIILSQNEGMITRLNEVDTIGVTVSVMKKHIVSSSIQRKGCLLINLVCEEEYLGSRTLCTAIAKVVIDALSRWRTEPDVQIEALACTQKLCEKSAMMSEALVHGDVHLLLFNMLYREHEEVGGNMPVDGDEDGGFIFRVGTDILYTLSCVRDFKQKMLTTAIKDGLPEGVSVLVDIGADVNGGEEPDTPICLAVQSKKKMMVEFLLQQGVNNVHRALNMACELGLNDIIGLLLQHIAVDRNGDVVNLSGLELQTIKSSWILPSLGVTNHFVYQRPRNLGHLKEMLRRKSISCLADKTLDALREGIEETDSGVVSSNAKPVSKSREQSPAVAVDERKRSCPNDSILSGSSGKMSDGSQKLSRSTHSSIDSLTSPPQAETASSVDHPRLQTVHPEFQPGVNPAELTQKLIETRASPPRSTPKRKLAASSSLTHVDYQPSLSPISGTPTQTLRRRILHEDSGIETVHGMELLSPPGHDQRRDSFDSTESVEGHSSRHTPRRRHQNGKATITGARQLPFSTADCYKQRSSGDRGEPPSETQSTTVEKFTISPRMVFRRLSMWKKKGRRRSSVASIDSMSRPDSPVPVIYQRGDYGEDFLSRESTPAHSSNPVSPRSSIIASEEIGPVPTWMSPERAADDDSRTSAEGPQRGNLSSSLKERTPSSAASSSLNTPSNTSRRSSIDFPYFLRTTRRDSRDEVDFGSIPEEPMAVLTKPNLVKVLDMSSNRLGSLAALVEDGDIVVQRLKELQRLDLKQNCLSRLPAELMEGPKKLTTINLSYNSFILFPREAVLSPALTELDISANKITRVPKLPTLPNLTKLNLNSNLLGEFPSEFNGNALPRLKVLNLRSNRISRIPNVESRLSDLEELNISKNQIQELPLLFLASLASLTTLEASRNQLSAIPGEVAEDLVHLQSLKVGHNFLGKAEADFNNFITLAPVLQSVDATENGLSTLPPPYAWKSRGIRDIRMNGNRISRLDLSDCGRFWPQLECLYLGQNKLREIPREIGNIRTLSCLDISHNKEIRNLPNEMGNLENLFMLSLQGLKNLSLDPSLLKGPTKAITSFLKSRHHKSVPYYHMKMMIVGGAGKGKTTLLRQLLQEKSSNFPRSNVATLGVNVKHWSYQRRAGVTYHVDCWDFAGQVEFYSTHQCFLTCRSLYVVVYNLSRGLSELDSLLPWLLNIQARAPSSPIIIVGTHVDKIKPADFSDRKRQMRTKIAEMVRKPGFPTDISFAEVGCFDEKLVRDLRSKIKELVDSAKLRGQKIMGGQVPLNYLMLEKLIQKEGERMVKVRCRFPVLQAGRLRELMDENKDLQKMDRAELDQAIHFLHECGILLHYNDLQSKLSELYFLEPEWLCTLMGNIITVSEVNSFISSEGTMPVNRIPHLLKEPKFPAEFIPEYTRLLERFEVVLRQTPDTLLITSCLPQERPTAIHLPTASPGSQIIRRYSMCYIPPGFWPRLVARLIAFPKRTLPKDQYISPQLKVWFGGIYSFWSEQAFFLIELLENKTNTFDIIVPATKLGTKLLCAVVDNVEALIDEWFPGLRDIDIMNGDELVLPMARCPLCPILSEPHCFKLKDLLKVALTADEVLCPQHKGTVLLEHLAPDIVISDLEPKYKLSPEEFSLAESSSNILGKGGFGEVYKAMCRGQTVAVKVFSQKAAEINNTTPNHLIRQEVSILSQLEHPNIISMVAVCLRPKPMLLLEYAELGSLKSLYPYTNVSMPLKHRIAVQVVGALAFLHKNHIIYRDLKPDNVLIFSLSIMAKVNAKLSDYGIACYATESGLIQPSGTAGYKAPELLKSNSTYNEKVDIYSYGLMLYVMMTNGHKPFEELSSGYEMDKAIEEGRTIKDIDHFGCPPWPDMQDLINHCLQYVASQRPKAQEVFDRLCSTEFVSLKRAISVEYDHSVETFSIRSFTDKHGIRKFEVWIASSLGSQTMLSTMNLSQKNASLQGMMMMKNMKVFSMAAMDPNLVVMGTHTGVIYVYDSSERKLKHQLKQLDDSVLCLTYFKSQTEGACYLCAGLANGKLAIYDQYMLQIPEADPRLQSLGTGPIRSMKRLHGSLYVCCGTEVVVIRISDFKEQKRWKAIEDSNGYLTCLEVGLGCVWTAHSRSPRIQLWDAQDGKLRGVLHCDALMKELLPEVTIDPRDARVTSMMLQPPPHSVLWVGLGSGYLVLINASTRTPLVAARRHMDAIRCIRSVKALVTDKPVHLVLTGGFGFRQRPGYEVASKGTPETYGSLLVWDSIMPRIKNTYDKIQKQQLPYR